MGFLMSEFRIFSPVWHFECIWMKFGDMIVDPTRTPQIRAWNFRTICKELSEIWLLKNYCQTDKIGNYQRWEIRILGILGIFCIHQTESPGVRIRTHCKNFRSKKGLRGLNVPEWALLLKIADIHGPHSLLSPLLCVYVCVSHDNGPHWASLLCVGWECRVHSSAAQPPTSFSPEPTTHVVPIQLSSAFSSTFFCSMTGRYLQVKRPERQDKCKEEKVSVVKWTQTELVTQWAAPETRTSNMENAALFSASSAPSHWFKLVLASRMVSGLFSLIVPSRLFSSSPPWLLCFCIHVGGFCSESVRDILLLPQDIKSTGKLFLHTLTPESWAAQTVRSVDNEIMMRCIRHQPLLSPWWCSSSTVQSSFVVN